MSAPRPFDLTEHQRVLWDSSDRDRAAILAMQQRIARNPIRDILWRKPWRASSRPNWASFGDVLDWLRKAHDCSDPSVGCSCSGGFRFPVAPPRESLADRAARERDPGRRAAYQMLAKQRDLSQFGDAPEGGTR